MYLKNILKASIPYRSSSTTVFSKRFLCRECLQNRSLIEVSGQETANFLQGLVTNDIEHLTENVSSIYTMFLNVQGRVMFDSIIYRADKDTYIIDCDSQATKPLINHMKLYKVRRKINFKEMDSFKVWVVYDNTDPENLEVTDLESLYIDTKSKEQSNFKSVFNLPIEVIITKDPRLKYLGDRIILPTTKTLDEYSHNLLTDGNFKEFRYKLGIGEGVQELTRGKCLPLEANCDYLHGVSFQKGCYIGQELTARTHFTGVIRKRVMPLVLEKDSAIDQKSSVINVKGQSVGKVIKFSGRYGIGVLRVDDALQAQKLSTGAENCDVRTYRPGWWPLEISKAKQTEQS